MTDTLLTRVLVPVATAADASATAAALAERADEIGTVVAVTVVDGDPDPTDAADDEATDTLGHVVRGLAGTGVDVETRVLAASGVVDAVVGAADEASATAVVFTPRDGPGPLGRITGDTTGRLVRESSRPVVALPAPDDRG